MEMQKSGEVESLRHEHQKLRLEVCGLRGKLEKLEDLTQRSASPISRAFSLPMSLRRAIEGDHLVRPCVMLAGSPPASTRHVPSLAPSHAPVVLHSTLVHHLAATQYTLKYPVVRSPDLHMPSSRHTMKVVPPNSGVPLSRLRSGNVSLTQARSLSPPSVA